MNKRYSLGVRDFLVKTGFEKEATGSLQKRFFRETASPGNSFLEKAREIALSDYDLHASIFLTESRVEAPTESLYWLVFFLLSVHTNGHLRIPLNGLEQELPRIFDEEHLPEDWRAMVSGSEELVRNNSSLFGGEYAPFTLFPEDFSAAAATVAEMERGFTLKIARRFQDNRGFVSELSPHEEETLIREIEPGFPLSAGQKCAVRASLRLRWLLISGGPGTGKTTVIISILRAFILRRKKQGFSARSVVATPTGRAAQRIRESFRHQPFPGGNDPLKENGMEALTIHKLLQMRPGFSDNPRFTRENPLPVDLLILDEASMVDVPLMDHLLEALPAEASLVLVGDPGQLPSVEAGAFFTDLISYVQSKTDDRREVLQVLEVCHRSRGEIAEAARMLTGEREAPEIIGNWKSCSEGFSLHGLPASMEVFARNYLRESPWKPLAQRFRFTQVPEPGTAEGQRVGEALRLLESHMILCPVRNGRWGVQAVNEAMMREISPRSLFSGLPIMISRNDYVNGLFNGDRGILFEAEGRFLAAFPGAEDQAYRMIPLSRMSDYLPSYCQTIHKSQGSEFERVDLLFTADSERFLSREILYTGITRAKTTLRLYGEDQMLMDAIERENRRFSGIASLLDLFDRQIL